MCGKRLKAWKTIPIPRRTSFTSTPRAVISSPWTTIRPAVDRLEQVDAAEERRLARARRADQADDLVLGEREVDAPQHLEPAERLAERLDASAAVRRRAHASLPACCRRLSRATSQSVKRAIGTVSATKMIAVAMYGV